MYAAQPANPRIAKNVTNAVFMTPNVSVHPTAKAAASNLNRATETTPLLRVGCNRLLGLPNSPDCIQVFGKLAELGPLFLLKAFFLIASMPDAIQMRIDVTQMNGEIFLIHSTVRFQLFDQRLKVLLHVFKLREHQIPANRMGLSVNHLPCKAQRLR
jgi:hypothetical protein